MAWGTFLWLLSMIPYFGPFIVFLLQAAGAIFTEVSWFLYVLIWKYPTTILSLIIDMVLLHSMVVMTSAAKKGYGYKAGMEGITTIFNDFLTIAYFLINLIKMVFVTLQSLAMSVIGIIIDLIPFL
jgi:hypothetical protein